MKKLGAILVVALFCCGFIPQHKASRNAAPQKGVSELYTDAIKAITIYNDTLKSISAIEAIFQQDSLYAPALNLFSRITKDKKRAVESAKRAYLSDTTNRYYLEDYGNALIEGAEYENATPIFSKIVQKSTDPNHYRILALLLGQKGRMTEALAVLDTADVRFGRIPALSKMRQFYLMKTGQTLAAEADALKDVREAPYLAENHITLAKIYAASKRDSLALVSFQRAIAVDSLAVEPWLELCEFYGERGELSAYLSAVLNLFKNEKFPLKYKLEEWERLAENKKDYRKFYNLYDNLIKQLYILHPDNREVADQYIFHLISSGETKEALRLCKRFLDPNAPKIEDFSRIIQIENHLARPDSVDHYAKLALVAFPKNLDLIQLRSNIAYMNKDYDGAISLLNEALKVTKNDTLRSEIWGGIGDIEHSRNRVKQAYKAYETALRLYRDNASVLNNYAYFLSLEKRDLERALTMATRANELSENNSTFLDTKAWVLYTLGRYAEAKKVMQLALSLNRSKSYEYMLHYGDILHALGEEFMAKTYWRKALEMGADAKEVEKRFLPENSTPQKQ